MFLGICAYMITQSIVLASTFAVSHNVEEAKDKVLSEDWGVRQVLHVQSLELFRDRSYK